MPLDLDDPTAIALAIFRALSARRIKAALYGGLALAAYGEPRETRDADFVLYKLLSTRDRDLEDAASVLRGPDLPLDRGAIEAEVVRLSGEITDHDVRGRFARLQWSS